ncbi:MAG TPA: hypothetical protein PK698_06365, partial [Bacilli bacterium]|nr:hypothetical protein [Bacilli bacterium]
MSSKLTKVISNFETQLSAKISAGGTTGNILSNLDSDGVAIPNGKYCMYVDGDNSQAEHLVFDLSGSAMSNIKSVSRQGVQTTGAVREHRIGAQVVITDFVNLKTLVDILNGSEPLDSTNPLYYDADAVFDDDNQLINKKYADSLTVAGLTSLFAYKESGLNLHINSGYYDRNGVNTFYAGATGVAMTDDATNYVELIDGVLSVNQTSFTDYSTAIAIVIASSGEITTVTDARAFSNTFDAKALGGIDKDSSGFFVKLEATNPTLQVNASNEVGIKIKSAGGLLSDSSGVYVDSSTFALKSDVSQQVRKAGENITALNYLCEVETSESYATGTDARNFADTTSSQRVRQSFKLPINTILKRIKINGLKMVGTPTTDLVIGIYDTDGSTLLGSYTLPYQALTTSYQDLDIPFATNINITANTTYWIDIRRSDDSYNGSNYYAWQSNASGGYANGKTQLYNSGTTTWADDSTRDCRFYAYYDVVMKADDGNNPSLGYSPIGFAYESVSKDADVKVITDGILDGFNFARYDLGTLKTYWNFTSTSSSHALVVSNTVGVAVTSWYYMDNIGFIKELDLYFTKYGTGQNVTVTIQKMDLAGAYQTIWTKTLLASEISTGVKTLYPNIAVDGGGAFTVVVTGATTTTGNYIAWNNTNSGVYTNWSKGTDNNQVNNRNNQYCVIRGYDLLYKEDCPIYLQNAGAISHIPEGTYSYQVGRVIDKTKI